MTTTTMATAMKTAAAIAMAALVDIPPTDVAVAWSAAPEASLSDNVVATLVVTSPVPPTLSHTPHECGHDALVGSSQPLIMTIKLQSVASVELRQCARTRGVIVVVLICVVEPPLHPLHMSGQRLAVAPEQFIASTMKAQSEGSGVVHSGSGAGVGGVGAPVQGHISGWGPKLFLNETSCTAPNVSSTRSGSSQDVTMTEHAIPKQCWFTAVPLGCWG